MSELPETRIALAVLPAGLDSAGQPRYWLERRADTAHLGGMLAFPGGKCLPDESPLDALARELFEELGIQPQESRLLIEVPWVYPAEPQARHLRLSFYQVTKWAGDLHGREGQTVVPQVLDCRQRSQWITALPPANRGVVAALCLPPRIAVTAPCGEGGQGFAQWQQTAVKTARVLRARWGDHAAVLQLRPARELTLFQWRLAVSAIEAEGVPVWVNAGLDIALATGANGVHLSSARLAAVDQAALTKWQADDRWVSASGHTEAEVVLANAKGVDVLLISPILPTQSHPGEPGIGWDRFAALTRQATMPTYALGGMDDGHLTQVQASGGQGVAAIRGYWFE